MIEQTRSTYPPCTGTIHQWSVVSGQWSDFTLTGPITNQNQINHSVLAVFHATSTIFCACPIQTSLTLGHRDAHHNRNHRIIIHLNTHDPNNYSPQLAPRPRSDNPLLEPQTSRQHRSRNT